MTRGMVATRDIDFGNEGKMFCVDKSRKICGYDRKHIIFIISTGSPCPEEAIDNALNRVVSDTPAVGLADACVRSRWFYIPFYGQKWYFAEGYPIFEIPVKTAPTASSVKEAPAAEQQDHNIKQGTSKKSENDLSDLPF